MEVTYIRIIREEEPGLWYTEHLHTRSTCMALKHFPWLFYEKKKEISVFWASNISDNHHWHLNQILSDTLGQRMQGALCSYMSRKSVSFTLGTPEFCKGWSRPRWTILLNLKNCIQKWEKTHPSQAHVTHLQKLITHLAKIQVSANIKRMNSYHICFLIINLLS